MENGNNPIIDIGQLKKELKKRKIMPVQVLKTQSQTKIIIENELNSFFDLVKSFGQEHIFFKYDFYNKNDYLIPEYWYKEHPKDYQDKIISYNNELDLFDFDDPKQLELFIIKDGVLMAIQFDNYFLEANNISSADDKIHELNYRFEFKNNSGKEGNEKELREIILKDPEFKYCKNQESRYWYMIELVEREGMEKFKYLIDNPGVYFAGKIKIFMDKTREIYKENQKNNI